MPVIFLSALNETDRDVDTTCHQVDLVISKEMAEAKEAEEEEAEAKRAEEERKRPDPKMQQAASPLFQKKYDEPPHQGAG